MTKLAPMASEDETARQRPTYLGRGSAGDSVDGSGHCALRLRLRLRTCLLPCLLLDDYRPVKAKANRNAGGVYVCCTGMRSGGAPGDCCGGHWLSIVRLRLGLGVRRWVS